MTWRAVLALALMLGGAVVLVGFPEQVRYVPEPPRNEAEVRLRAMGEDYGSVAPNAVARRRLAERGKRTAERGEPVVEVALDLR